jgi:4-diphosphocytidyl-2-C-methyl-D-erythritol kinase
MKELTLSVPAKINLCLSVLSKRPDGYHDVEMLMQMVSLYDHVTVSLKSDPGIEIECDNAAVPTGKANIAWKAADVMLRRFRPDAGFCITIRKAIPLAAGLAGGSGNAAAVLVAANYLLNAGCTRADLGEMGTSLGMDIPFFFHGPTAFARGRGEIVTAMSPPPRCPVLLVNPGFETSTAWVYKNLNLRLTKKGECNKIARLTLRNIFQELHNDLETVTAGKYPVVGEIRRSLIEAGASGSIMSGSGPTVFGLFETEAVCQEAAVRLSDRGWNLFQVETLDDSPLNAYVKD